MKPRLTPDLQPGADKAAPGKRRRWLLFVHQLPSHPSNLRVRTWRRLQQLGAVPIKQAVYALPDSPGGREDFEWLKAEIKGAGGDASVFAADHVDSWSDDALVEEFRRARQESYAGLTRDVERVLVRLAPGRRRRGARAPSTQRLLGVFRERLAAIEAVDFFGSAGRDRVAVLLKQLEERSPSPPRGAVGRQPGASTPGEAYRGRLWVTRPRPGVDRMASAWLIRRFIDGQARFDFAPSAEGLAEGAVPFDMFGVDFSHRGDGCTFETLCEVFVIREAAVSRVAEIVHDLDLKDGRFGPPEGATVGAVIEGLQLAHSDDHELLLQGVGLFEALYLTFDQSARTRPRAVARPARAKARKRGR